MAVEARRGCGFRKVGGIYLVSGGLSEPCHRLPFVLDVCPTCGHGLKPSRGWQWVDGTALFSPACSQPVRSGAALHAVPFEHCLRCVICDPAQLGRAGLLWVGERFYPTPGAFTREAERLGVSRRIGAIPHGFKVGETWVLLAHRKASSRMVQTPDIGGEVATEVADVPAIFRAFLPQRIETLVTQLQSKDAEYMASLEQRGITPIIVPDDDKDHQGSVYDVSQDDLPLEEGVS